MGIIGFFSMRISNDCLFKLIGAEPRPIDPLDSLSKLTRYHGGLTDCPGHGSSDAAFLEDKQPSDRTPTWGANFVPQQSRVLAVQHKARGAPHGLRSHAHRLGTGQAHSHGPVDGGLEHQRKEGGTGAAERRAGVHGRGREVDDVADALEDPRHQAGLLGRQGRVARCNDRHALADERGGVGHGAHDHAPLALAAQIPLDLLTGHPSADADQQLAFEGRSHARLGEHVLDHLWLAAEEDDLGFGDSLDIIPL